MDALKPDSESERSAEGGDGRADETSARGMKQSYTGPDDYRGISAHGLASVGGLRSAKQFAEMIVDTVQEGLLVLNLDLRVVAANEYFYRMFKSCARRPKDALSRIRETASGTSQSYGRSSQT
jgi:hypothetical protein